MVIIQTALYREAKRAIEYFGLREVRDQSLPVRLFISGEKDISGKSDISENSKAFEKTNVSGKCGIAAVVTGTGAINACAGVSSALTYLRASRGDVLINFGIAGACGEADLPNGLEIGDVVRCVKCTARGERPFYPDVIFGSKYKLAEVVTVRSPLESADVPANGSIPQAADMELYYAFQAAAFFLGPESLISYKVISDRAGATAGNGGRLDPDTALRTISRAWDILISEVEKVADEAKKAFSKKERKLPGDTEELFEKVCAKLSISYANREILKNRLRKDILSGAEAAEVNEKLNDVIDQPDGAIPKDKKGREAFLKDRLLRDGGGDLPD